MICCCRFCQAFILILLSFTIFQVILEAQKNSFSERLPVLSGELHSTARVKRINVWNMTRILNIQAFQSLIKLVLFCWYNRWWTQNYNMCTWSKHTLYSNLKRRRGLKADVKKKKKLTSYEKFPVAPPPFSGFLAIRVNLKEVNLKEYVLLAEYVHEPVQARACKTTWKAWTLSESNLLIACGVTRSSPLSSA